MTVSGIPTTRVSDLFISNRLLKQVQSDQVRLYNLQMQLSTGQRFQLPSEDPVSAMQVIGLQRLLERKTQVQTNIQTNQSFLTMTDSALSSVADLAAEASSVGLGAIGATSSDSQREAAAQQIRQIIEEMYTTANQKSRGRYLFAGSRTSVCPFQIAKGNYIEYVGNQQRLSSYGDTNLLFETNVTGDEAFGALSAGVAGTDTHPALTFETRLADLHGGAGVELGSIELSDGVHKVNVDLSNSATIGDVALMIRSEGAKLASDKWVTADVTSEGLVVELHASDGSPAGSLTICEVGNGTTASELGILHEEASGSKIVGESLHPTLRATTNIQDLLGARSTAFLHSSGSDNDLIIRADHNGDLNDIPVVVVADPTVVAGNETVEYAAGTLTIRIKEGATTAANVVAAFEKYYDPETMPFTAELDPQDSSDGGQGLVARTDASNAVSTDCGWGEDLDTEHGLQLVNGDQEVTISLSSVETVGDLLNAINGQGAGLLAEINSSATGIDIHSRYSGADFSIGENGGRTATQLGLRSFTGETRLEDLNFGRGIVDLDENGEPIGDADNSVFIITLRDGTSMEVDVAGVTTIQEVLDAINNQAANHPELPLSERPLEARLATYGNGIELVDRTDGPGTLTVSQSNFSVAANRLGLIPEGMSSNSEAGVAGEPAVLTGSDVNPSEAEGMFTALVRLQHGLETNDQWEISRAMELLNESVENLSFCRADLGARQQSLDLLSDRLDTEDTDLNQVLSVQYDADLVQVITEFSTAQTAFEASLRATAQISGMSLLNYL